VADVGGHRRRQVAVLHGLRQGAAALADQDADLARVVAMRPSCAGTPAALAERAAAAQVASRTSRVARQICVAAALVAAWRRPASSGVGLVRQRFSEAMIATVGFQHRRAAPHGGALRSAMRPRDDTISARPSA
jgi:hypothetical protein